MNIRSEGNELMQPNLNTHCIDIDFLVKVVEEGDCLYDHGVHLVRRELELESGASISSNIPEFRSKATHRDKE